MILFHCDAFNRFAIFKTLNTSSIFVDPRLEASRSVIGCYPTVFWRPACDREAEGSAHSYIPIDFSIR